MVISTFKVESRFGGEKTEAPTLEVDVGDGLEIVCPRKIRNKPYEYLKIHMVSDMAFLSCQLESRSKEFVVCDGPNMSTHKVVFRKFSPVPNAFEYFPGRTYYLITTSDGTWEGLNNTSGGLCISRNMRYQIYVRLNDRSRSPSSGEHSVDSRPISEEETAKLRHYSRSRNSASEKKPEQSDESFKIDGSIDFASKYGIHLSQLKYVSKLASGGAEGPFSFQKNEEERRGATTEASDHVSKLSDKALRTNRFETFLEPASLPLSSDATTSDKSVKRGRSEDRTLRRETYDDPFNE
ncbi:unnamed protein product, partial [Enterobius vermicularis]|uniref:Ephrin RBD domain-containing protein n=1 Tax=Enterobius vermicularis TaxID=51028 RepID=A0A0N4VGE1_ENTVE